VSWKYNAVKTMRHVHPNMWSDDEVTVLHYVVDKPWKRQVSSEGVAGYHGRDGERHQWWWNLFKEWHEDAGASTEGLDVVAVTKKLVDTEEPFTKKPLPQSSGRPDDDDVKPWP
jgi:inositol 3-alpha-galactosyltransferase